MSGSLRGRRSNYRRHLRQLLLHSRFSTWLWEWDSIKEACDSRTMRASYIFLAIIPVLTKVLSPIPDRFKVSILNKDFDVVIALPFTWWLLFVAACCGSFAGLIYAARCPRLIRQFGDFASYESSRRGTRPLARTVDEIVGRVATFVVENGNPKKSMMAMPLKEVEPGVPFSGTMVGGRSAQLMTFRDYVPWAEDTIGVDIALNEGRVTPELFYFVHDGAKRSRPIARLIATIAIALAYFCFAAIGAQSAWSVFCYVWRS